MCVMYLESSACDQAGRDANRSRSLGALGAHATRDVARPDVAYAVRCLSLMDQLELTLELPNEWQEAEPELPWNVIPLRPRRSH